MSKIKIDTKYLLERPSTRMILMIAFGLTVLDISSIIKDPDISNKYYFIIAMFCFYIIFSYITSFIMWG